MFFSPNGLRFSALRFMAGRGQSSDPALPSWVADPAAGIPRLLRVPHRERASVQHRRLPLDDDRRHNDPVLTGMAVGARAEMRGRGDAARPAAARCAREWAARLGRFIAGPAGRTGWRAAIPAAASGGARGARLLRAGSDLAAGPRQPLRGICRAGPKRARNSRGA